MKKAVAHGFTDFDGLYAAQQLRRSRDPLRRCAKDFYLRDLLQDSGDPTVASAGTSYSMK